MRSLRDPRLCLFFRYLFVVEFARVATSEFNRDSLKRFALKNDLKFSGLRVILMIYPGLFMSTLRKHNHTCVLFEHSYPGVNTGFPKTKSPIHQDLEGLIQSDPADRILLFTYKNFLRRGRDLNS
jgi:hypothetical protein